MTKLTTLITDTMDLMAGFDIDTQENKKETLQAVINHLGSYPKPRQKGDTAEPHPNILGAYLCVSNVRNACKLAQIGVYSLDTVTLHIDENLISALNLILNFRNYSN